MQAQLKQAFETAWARQPEARGGDLRRAAADAVAMPPATGWWPRPALEMSAKSDRANSDKGTREYDVGVGLPLWLPGERGGAQALADAEARCARQPSACSATASVAAECATPGGTMRDCPQPGVEVEVAKRASENAEQLAGDVGRASRPAICRVPISIRPMARCRHRAGLAGRSRQCTGDWRAQRLRTLARCGACAGGAGGREDRPWPAS